jgi:hypothetical protein
MFAVRIRNQLKNYFFCADIFSNGCTGENSPSQNLSKFLPRTEKVISNIPTTNIIISILTWDCMWVERLHQNTRQNESMGRTYDDYSP